MNTLYELVSPDLVVDVVDDPNGSLWLITVSLAGADSRKEAPQLLVMASNEQRAQDVAAKHEAQWLSDTEEEDLIAREGRLADFGTCSLLARPLARQLDTLEALNELRKQMAKLDERMTNPDGKGEDDRPPTGDDYNSLFNLIDGGLIALCRRLETNDLEV